MEEKELYNEILTLIEKFEAKFNKGFDIELAEQEARGLPIIHHINSNIDEYVGLMKKAQQGEDVSNYTFTIIKPNVMKNGKSLELIQDIINGGFKIFAGRRIVFSKIEAEAFYEEHKDKPFYGELVDFMTSYPVYTIILEKENAVEDYRKLMGSMDEPESLRGKYADSFGENAVHGSDSVESFKREMNFL